MCMLLGTLGAEISYSTPEGNGHVRRRSKSVLGPTRSREQPYRELPPRRSLRGSNDLIVAPRELRTPARVFLPSPLGRRLST